MTSVPWKLFEEEGMLGGKPKESMGVAMTFLPQDAASALEAQAVLEAQVETTQTDTTRQGAGSRAWTHPRKHLDQ